MCVSRISKGGAERLSYRQTALGGNYRACKIIKRSLSASKLPLIVKNTHPGTAWSAAQPCSGGGGVVGPRDAAASPSVGL